MNIEQFIKLTEAYGAEIKHWPEFHQQNALKLISLNLPEVNQALAQARLLDEMFSSHEIAPVERALFDHIVESAPKQNNKIFLQFLKQWNIKSWLSFSGLVGTGLAGALAGAFFVSIWTSGNIPENMGSVSESSGPMAQYVDIGQEWS